LVFFIAVVGGYLLFSKNVSIYIDGTAFISPLENNAILVSLGHEEISKLQKANSPKVEFMVPDIVGRRFDAKIDFVQPDNGVIVLAKPEGTDGKFPDGRFDVRIYLCDARLWKLMVSKK
jgi:hypothetical protein